MTDPKIRPARRARPVTTATPRQKRAAYRQAGAAPAAPAAPDATPKAPNGPTGKLGVVVALMRRPEGATVTQMSEATGWQPHSVRGALAGALKRKHRLTIVGEPGEGGRVYRIAAAQPS